MESHKGKTDPKVDHMREKFNAKRVAEFFRKETIGPSSQVVAPSDIHAWQMSKAYFILISYINDVSNNIQGIRTNESYPVSNNVVRLLTIFDGLDALITANPPMQTDGNAGSRTYRRWARDMLREIYEMVEKALPLSKCKYVNELGQYLSTSFGNYTKMDYGIGHELSFLFFVCGLFQAEILVRSEDLAASALVLFMRYLKFVRRLVVTYRVSPTHSRTAYSLDKYSFVPFIWGVAQMCYEAPISPRQMLDEEIVANYKHDYLLINCVGHLMDTNIGSFAFHSNQLWTVASLSSWLDLYRGMMFMYTDEILLDYDMMRQARFGELMPFDPVKGTLPVAARLGIISELRRKMLGATPVDPLSQATSASAIASAIASASTSYTNVARTPVPLRLTTDSFSDEISHSGMSMGSECTSLSDVDVHLPNWLEEDTDCSPKKQ